MKQYRLSPKISDAYFCEAQEQKNNFVPCSLAAARFLTCSVTPLIILKSRNNSWFIEPLVPWGKKGIIVRNIASRFFDYDLVTRNYLIGAGIMNIPKDSLRISLCTSGSSRGTGGGSLLCLFTSLGISVWRFLANTWVEQREEFTSLVIVNWEQDSLGLSTSEVKIIITIIKIIMWSI